MNVDVETVSSPTFPEADDTNDIVETPYPDENDALAKREGLEDYETFYEETTDGEDDAIGGISLPRIIAQRVTEVSDTVIFGHAEFAANQGAGLFIPQHRDRLRVTIQTIAGEGAPVAYIGRGPDVAENNGWGLYSSDPLILRTRAAIWVATGDGAGTVTVQWAIELVEES